MRSPFRWIAPLSIACLALFRLSGQGVPAQSIWDDIYKSSWAGIYTNDQAARGESSYRLRCASCHGASLEGSDDAPPLSGRDFTKDWNCANLADLFEKIQYTMPSNRPGRLSQNEIAEILSYILKVNRFPAGRSALPPSVDDLRGLVFLAENPRPR